MINAKIGGSSSLYKKIEFEYFTTLQENKVIQEESKIIEPKYQQKSVVLNKPNAKPQNFKNFLNSQFSAVSKESQFKSPVAIDETLLKPIIFNIKKLNRRSIMMLRKQNKFAKLLHFKIIFSQRRKIIHESKEEHVSKPEAIKVKSLDTLERNISQWSSKDSKILNAQGEYRGLKHNAVKLKDQYDIDYDKGKLKKIKKKKAKPQILDFQKIVKRQQREQLQQQQEQ